MNKSTGMAASPGLVSRRIFILDASLMAIISVLICFASGKLILMTIAIPLLLLIRLIVAGLISKMEGWKLFPEIVFFSVCTILGAFNDWNSVVNKGIYDYHVPHLFDFSTIPFWMLLYWGLILRFMAGIAWRISNEKSSDKIGIGKLAIENGLVKAVLGLIFLLLTRQFIYRFYLDPVWSWLPFLIAIAIYFITAFPSKKDIWLVSAFLLGGPVIEMIYINIGELHSYHLGWIGGVPLWIILWWILAILIWKDIGGRLYKMLDRV